MTFKTLNSRASSQTISKFSMRYNKARAQRRKTLVIYSQFISRHIHCGNKNYLERPALLPHWTLVTSKYKKKIDFRWFRIIIDIG